MRQKVRLRNNAKIEVYQHAVEEADKNIYPQFKRFVNALPFIDRAKLSWRLLWRKF